MSKLSIFILLIFGLVAGTGIWLIYSSARNYQAPSSETPIYTTRSPEPALNITVSQPEVNARISSPVTIIGTARVFENQFNYRVQDSNGVILAQGYSMSDAPDVGVFGGYTLNVTYKKPTAQTGVVEVFDYSAKDGAVENLVSIPVFFAD
jgi:hypothetical protein